MRRTLGTVTLVVLVLSAPISLAADASFTFIGVGQGDAIWVSDDTGFDLLVDSGSRGMGGRVLQAVASREDLDVAVCPHGHEDHIGGLIEVPLTADAEMRAESAVLDLRWQSPR